MYIYLYTLVALDVLLPESVSSTRYCFEYCRYVFYTKQPTLDSRCDCFAIAELFAKFMSQSPSTLADHQALALPQNDYKQADSYPIKIIPYTEQRYLVQKPTSKNPLMKETEKIKINNSTSSVKRPKKTKCKKRSDSKKDKSVVEKQKNSTIQSDKDPFKMPMRKPNSIVESEFDRNYTVPVELNQTQSAHILNVNDSDAVQDKHGHVDFQENDTSVETHRPVLNKLNSIEDITTKQESDYFKEQNSQLTTNTTDDIVFSTKNSKPTNGNDTERIPFVFKFHNDEFVPTTQDNPVSTTIKTSENHIYSTTPSYIYNDSATLKNDINRETYNEREVPLQKIITKELTNGSVISYINGTENLLNNEFIDMNSSGNLFPRSNMTEFKIDKPPQLIANSTKRESRKTPIAATFNFIFVSIHSKLEEISDDKILS